MKKLNYQCERHDNLILLKINAFAIDPNYQLIAEYSSNQDFINIIGRNVDNNNAISFVRSINLIHSNEEFLVFRKLETNFTNTIFKLHFSIIKKIDCLKDEYRKDYPDDPLCLEEGLLLREGMSSISEGEKQIIRIKTTLDLGNEISSKHVKELNIPADFDLLTDQEISDIIRETINEIQYLKIKTKD